MENTRQLALSLKLPGDVTVDPPVGFSAGDTLGAVIGKMIPYFFVFAGIGLLLMLIVGGFQLLTGGSDPKSLESGKQRITYAIVGFLIVFLAYWLVQLVALVFGINEFKCIFGLQAPGCNVDTGLPGPV